MPVKEIRFHGRGGQGAVLAAKMVATAAALEGKSVASFPVFGFERRGMPVVAFTRFDNQPIRIKTQIYTPDCLIVVDPTLLNLKDLFKGLKPGGVVIINHSKAIEGQMSDNLEKLGVVNGTQIALTEIGKDVPNTCLLGALAKITGWVSLDSILTGLGHYLDGSMLEKNKRSVQRGYDEVEVKQWT